MTHRAVAVVLTGRPGGAGCPPGLDPAALDRAMASDVADLLSDLVAVDPLVLVPDQLGTDRTILPAGQVLVAPDGVSGALGALHRRGYDQVALVAPDAPDLPGLVVAKTLSAMTSRQVAAAPAAHGGLVVLASRLPAPAWLTEAGVDLDTPDAVDRLRAAAPHRDDLAITPGWHRIRRPGDTDRLDPGLEGWYATRTLLGVG